MTRIFRLLFLPIASSLLVLLLVQCASVKQTVLLPELPPQERITTTQVPYPILLLHGLGQKSAVWDAYAVQYYERDMKLRYGGVLKKTNGQYMLESKNPSGASDFFTVSFSNPIDSIGAWKNELEQYIRLVLERTRAEKVILIGYSMGGVAGRYYLTEHINDHHVRRLVTVGSPHQGSPYAKVYQWKTALANAARETSNPLASIALNQALNVVKGLERDVPFDAFAVRDLLRPEDGGEFMRRTGVTQHPLDIEYISIVGKVEVFKELEGLSKAGVQELLRRVLEFLGFGLESLFTEGDGVVSAKSQTITELPWFQADPNRRRIARTITLSTVHEDHLRNSTEIQRVSLEDQPEFKGAEFYQIGGKPALVVEFGDNLPPQTLTVTITVSDLQNPKATPQRFSIPNESVSLVRKQNGSVVAQAVLPFPSSLDVSKPMEFSFTVKNSYGNQFTNTKSWVVR